MKSASEFKPKMINGDERRARQAQLDEMPTLEETWENAKQAFVNTAEVSVELAKRIDNLMNIRDMVYKFWDGRGVDHTITVEYLKEKLNLSIQTYKNIYDIVIDFEMEEFLKEDMKDYFDVLIPKIEEIEYEEDLLDAAIIFLTVKPWGEKMTALHHTMLDEKKQREYLEKGE